MMYVIICSDKVLASLDSKLKWATRRENLTLCMRTTKVQTTLRIHADWSTSLLHAL